MGSKVYEGRVKCTTYCMFYSDFYELRIVCVEGQLYRAELGSDQFYFCNFSIEILNAIY